MGNRRRKRLFSFYKEVRRCVTKCQNTVFSFFFFFCYWCDDWLVKLMHIAFVHDEPKEINDEQQPTTAKIKNFCSLVAVCNCVTLSLLPSTGRRISLYFMLRFMGKKIKRIQMPKHHLKFEKNAHTLL